jgi:TPR repeat protein
MRACMLVLFSILVFAVGDRACAAKAAGAIANPNGIAIIIGNKAYTRRDVPAVDYADRDAAAMHDYAIQLLGLDPQNVITVPNAALSDMISLFGTAALPRGRLARLVGPADVAGNVDVFVFYSGHGFPGLEDHKGYLLPVDADPRAPEATGYPLDLLVENIRKLGARSALLVIDACFSGEGSGGKALLPRTSVMVRAADPVAAATRMTILTASGPTEPANWDVPARHGLMTEFFLRAVYGAADDPGYGGRGDGKVTAHAVKRFLDAQMTRWAARELDSEQQASLSGDPASVLAVFTPGHPPARPDLAAIVAPPSVPSTPPYVNSPGLDIDTLLEQAGELDDRQQYAEALAIYRRLADAGNALAMKRIGGFYDDGRGVSHDDAEALRWYRKAADLGDDGAMNNIGAMYESGQGVARDWSEAARWYRRASEKGNGIAMSNLGALYSLGHGVPRDYAQANRWYLKGAEAGSKAALINLGVQYDIGEGVPKDYAQAVTWFRRAADGGDAFAMVKLASHYEKGLGVPRSLDEARHWYRRAEEAGNGAAAAALARIGR